MISTSLAGLPWQFRDTREKTWLPATVPGCVHTDLLAAGRIQDPFYAARERELQWIGEHDWEYRTVWKVGPEASQAEVTELVFDGLDTLATVLLNGEVVGRADNMFTAYRWDVTRRLRRGRNELRVVFKSAEQALRTTRTDFTPPREYCDPVGNAVRLRKQPSQFGWDWGPRLVSAGIWRDLRLESWTTNRLDHLHITQNHREEGSVDVVLSPIFERVANGVAVTATASFAGEEVARATGDGGPVTLTIRKPWLWWPAGQGDQPLYDIEVVARDLKGNTLGSVHRRLGLRTLLLDRHPDAWGESFQFVVNGRPVFAKGANWVPAHAFVTALDRDRYARDLRAAVAANMNCLRAWGGGIYESEAFFDLCDELGLMVWQDFMFSCALYPSDAEFVESVRQEAVYQVKRLHHRACLALWCGNNELAQLNTEYLKADAGLMKGYEAIFHNVLPKVVAEYAPQTAYWPSSEWRGSFSSGHALGEQQGDSHFWDVWHARHPVKAYERWTFRFCSEFGMQSYSSAETNAGFCPPGQTNVFGPAMENHQKNAHGNQVILDYVCRRFRFPRSHDDLIYLSQLNQAYCMQVGVEHYRRNMPRCMGALYWQLNDCWPAISWSSIEFSGRWKALQFSAKRFFAPYLVTAHVLGDEVVSIGNRRSQPIDEVRLYTVSDQPASSPGVLRWRLMHLDNSVLLDGRKKVRLRYGESVLQTTLRLARVLTPLPDQNVYLRISLEVDGAVVSEQAVFLIAPRHLDLPRAPIDVQVARAGPRRARLTLRSPVFQSAVTLELPGLRFQADDNFFDLFPDETKQVLLELESEVSVRHLRQTLQVRALADSYE